MYHGRKREGRKRERERNKERYEKRLVISGKLANIEMIGGPVYGIQAERSCVAPLIFVQNTFKFSLSIHVGLSKVPHNLFWQRLHAHSDSFSQAAAPLKNGLRKSVHCIDHRHPFSLFLSLTHFPSSVYLSRVVELTGDFTPDVRAINQADLIVTTPEKWDGVSRSWQSRSYVRQVCAAQYCPGRMISSSMLISYASQRYQQIKEPGKTRLRTWREK